MYIRYNPETGQSFQMPGQFVGSTPSVITTDNFNNTQVTSPSPLYSLLQAGSTLVDWGIAEEQQNTVVDRVVFRLGVDSANPQARLFLLNDYEGFGDQNADVIEIPLPGPLPADTINPGNGLSVAATVVVSISPPLNLPSRCIGWAVNSVSGDVGPRLVDTQCAQSALGPAFRDYEANPIANDFQSQIGSPDMIFSSTGGAQDQSFSVPAPDGFEFFPNAGAIRATTSGYLLQAGGDAGHDGQCVPPYTQNGTGSPVLMPFLDRMDWDGAGSSGLFITVSDDDVWTYSWENLNSLIPGTPTAPGLNFQIKVFPHGDRIEYHYGTMDVNQGGLGAFATVGLAGPNGNDSLILSCNTPLISGNATALAFTRGEQPVNNGVTNKLVAYTSGGGSTGLGSPFDNLASQGNLNGAGFGAIASMNVEIRRLGGCADESFTVETPGITAATGLSLDAAGTAAFEGAIALTLSDNNNRNYPFGFFVVTPPFNPLPTPLGPLAVNLAAQLVLQAVPSNTGGGVDTTNFNLGIPPYDVNVCGTSYNIQGAIFSPGNPIVLSEDYVRFTVGL